MKHANIALLRELDASRLSQFVSIIQNIILSWFQTVKDATPPESVGRNAGMHLKRRRILAQDQMDQGISEQDIRREKNYNNNYKRLEFQISNVNAVKLFFLICIV